MSKHTPGPWEMVADPYGPMQAIMGNGRRMTVVDRLPDWTDEEAHEELANARLIAAAPDMLKALMAAHHRMSNIGCNYDRDDDFRAVCDAIAKAEGRERAPNEQAVEARAHHPRGA